MREKVAHLPTINAGVKSSYAGEGSIDLADQRINRLPRGDSNIVIHQVFQRKENELVCRNITVRVTLPEVLNRPARKKTGPTSPNFDFSPMWSSRGLSFAGIA